MKLKILTNKQKTISIPTVTKTYFLLYSNYLASIKKYHEIPQNKE